MSDEQPYYVVKKGHQTGIFRTWDECKRATWGYSGPVFRKFPTFEAANEFYHSKTIPLSRTNSTNSTGERPKIVKKMPYNPVESPLESGRLQQLQEELTANIRKAPFADELNYTVEKWTIINDEIYIFTDGSARKSQNMPNSGVGVYLGYHCMNIKEQYNDKTNNMCELTAVYYAFKLITRYWRELSEMEKIVKIVSDSEYTIKACSVWLQQWKTNNWITSSGDPVKNRELIEGIDNSMQRIKLINSRLEGNRKIRVKFIHVNSHQNMPDSSDKLNYDIWLGNHIADCLASNTI